MGSPVTSANFPALASTAPVCARLRQLLSLWGYFGEFLGWLLDGNGELSDAVLAGTTDRMMPVGAILMYASHTPPTDKWMLCTGQAISRTDYSDLFSRIGTQYGDGDGSTTFNLPDMRDRFPVGSGQAYSNGGTGGEATHTLTVSELPSHTHANGLYSHVLQAPAVGSITGADTVNSDTEANVQTSAAMASVGGGEAHENRPPYLAVSFMIKVK